MDEDIEINIEEIIWWALDEGADPVEVTDVVNRTMDAWEDHEYG